MSDIGRTAECVLLTESKLKALYTDFHVQHSKGVGGIITPFHRQGHCPARYLSNKGCITMSWMEPE